MEIVISILIIIGAALALIGSFGLAKLPDFYTRLHGPSKATTLGLGCILIGAALHGAEFSLRPVLITLFLFITAPVSAHLLARAAMARHVHSVAKVPAAAGEKDHA